MIRSLDRGAYILIVLVIVGIAAAFIVPFCVLDGDGDGSEAEPTATAGATPDGDGATPTGAAPTATAGETPTATPEGFTDPDSAFLAFIDEEFGGDFIGDCPQTVSPETGTGQICGQELYRSDELVTYSLGVPFSEGLGEAVVAIDAAGFWTVTFVPAPAPGEGDLAIGGAAAVFGAGSCLNFRDEPGTGSEVLLCMIDGTSERVIDGPVEADGITWWRLQGLGWASEEFLVPLVN